MGNSTRAVLMVRPSGFGYNSEAAADNLFQFDPGEGPDPAAPARMEFQGMVDTLAGDGVDVVVWDEPAGQGLPDAVFPNNWLSTHEDGTVFLYPMASAVRRKEVRSGPLDALRHRGFRIDHLVDWSGEAEKGIFLEGTGSLVLDRRERMAYAALSSRTHPGLVRRWADRMGYQFLCFHTELDGLPVYHTNVILTVGETFALVCLDVIPAAEERAALLNSLRNSGRSVVTLTRTQVRNFAGNALGLENRRGEHLLVLSSRAAGSLQPEQLQQIAHHARLVPVDIPVIESVGGGSARCMMAEIFLPSDRLKNE